MVRPSIKANIPDYYGENERKGLCRVCGKNKDKWENGRRVVCSYGCSRKNASNFIYWSTFRDIIIKKHPYCKKCCYEVSLCVDHIIPFAITGVLFDKSNLQVLCSDCHKKKTKKDLIEIKNYKNKQEILFHGT